MDGKRRWFGWVAIGLGAAALLVALLGRGFGAQMGAARPGANAQQQSVGPQAGPGMNAQPGAGQQSVGPQAGPGSGQQSVGPQAAPDANAQPGAGRQNAGPQAGPGGEARRGPERSGDGGFGIGGLLRFPFRLIGGSFQWIMLALLIGLGVWMLRGRNTGAASGPAQAEPAQGAPQAPLSPTGEAYIEEPGEEE